MMGYTRGSEPGMLQECSWCLTEGSPGGVILLFPLLLALHEGISSLSLVHMAQAEQAEMPLLPPGGLGLGGWHIPETGLKH